VPRKGIGRRAVQYFERGETTGYIVQTQSHFHATEEGTQGAERVKGRTTAKQLNSKGTAKFNRYTLSSSSPDMLVSGSSRLIGSLKPDQPLAKLRHFVEKVQRESRTRDPCLARRMTKRISSLPVTIAVAAKTVS